jgi:hypothetical protein
MSMLLAVERVARVRDAFLTALAERKLLAPRSRRGRP